MAKLVDTLMQTLGSGGIEQISRQLGVDEQQANQVVQAALPLLVSALARNASSQEGAAALTDAVARDHDGTALSHLQETIQNYQAGPGDGILGHVLGAQRPAVEQGLSQSTGLDAGALLQMLAPLVLGALGQQQRQQGLDPSGVASELQQEQAELAQSDNQLMAMATRLLDANRDGSVVDDVIGMMGRFFGGQRS